MALLTCIGMGFQFEDVEYTGFKLPHLSFNLSPSRVTVRKASLTLSKPITLQLA